MTVLAAVCAADATSRECPIPAVPDLALAQHLGLLLVCAWVLKKKVIHFHSSESVLSPSESPPPVTPLPSALSSFDEHLNGTYLKLGCFLCVPARQGDATMTCLKAYS
jgi:hypothetical protein